MHRHRQPTHNHNNNGTIWKKWKIKVKMTSRKDNGIRWAFSTNVVQFCSLYLWPLPAAKAL